MGRVLNFGSLNLDYVYSVDHFVKPGETMSAKTQKINPGGKGLNQSCALARAGADVFHAGCVGRGGEALIQILRENSVDTSYLIPTQELQGNAVIQVDSCGENCILLFGGSNRCITEQQVTETLSGFGKGDVLILQNEINQLSLIVETAYQRGMTIILNPSPYDERLDAVDFGKLSWLLVNEVEAGQIADSPAASRTFCPDNPGRTGEYCVSGGWEHNPDRKTEGDSCKSSRHNSGGRHLHGILCCRADGGQSVEGMYAARHCCSRNLRDQRRSGTFHSIQGRSGTGLYTPFE